MILALGLGAAVLLATGYVLQQHEAATIEDARLSVKLLFRLARRPVWLGGIGAMVAGQLLGATALGMGSLVVVEPLLAANVLFALPLAAVASRRHLSIGDWTGAALLVGGLALFLVGSSSREAVDAAGLPLSRWIPAGVSVAGLVLLLLLLSRNRSPRPRAALIATAAGTMFGLQDFLTQRTMLRLGGGLTNLLTSWPPYLVLAIAVVGLTFAQRAFGLADLSASLPAITLAEPVGGIALSVGVLGQGLPDGTEEFAIAIAGLVIMISGVVILTRSPLVVDPHGKSHRIHLPHPHWPTVHRGATASRVLRGEHAVRRSSRHRVRGGSARRLQRGNDAGAERP